HLPGRGHRRGPWRHVQEPGDRRAAHGERRPSGRLYLEEGRLRPGIVPRPGRRSVAGVREDELDPLRVRLVERVEGGGLNQRTSIHPPTRISTAPLRRAPRSPKGDSFSNATNAVSAAITARFITPPTNSSSISAQQHPTQ